VSAAIPRPTRREQLAVLLAALAASLIAIVWSARNHAFLLYGDAEAHMHIARRIFDSHRPGVAQLGSVWLPLPHLLLVPFVAVDPWWRSGFAPVIPSAACYLLACLGLYRLARKWLTPLPAFLALALFLLNPNLLYLQTTAMTEPLFLCELIWSVLLLVEWRQNLTINPGRTIRLLWALIAVLVAAVFTRYDGWILAFFIWLVMAVVLARRGQLMRRHFILASVVLLLAPISWMVYNAAIFGDWLDFMRGPYSAAAIEARTAGSVWPPHPGWHNCWVSLLFFVKAAKMDAAVEAWGSFLLLVSALGSLAVWRRVSRHNLTAPVPGSSLPIATPPAHNPPAILYVLFLWLPVPFYAYSIAYGSVPIFLPVWWPHSWYNTRYGMELLPALAFGFGCFAQLLLVRAARFRLPRFPFVIAAILFAALGVNIAAMLHEGPLTYIEGKKNSQSRSYFNTLLSGALRRLTTADPAGVVLMDTSTYSSVVPLAGLTYRQTINESDKQFYAAALAAPAAHAGIVLAFAGTDIDKAVHAHPEHLRLYQTVRARGSAWDQLDASIYVIDTFPHSAPAPSAPATPPR
jgi:hypothetical protein